MSTRTTRKTRPRRAVSRQDAAQEALGRGVGQWLTFTLATDTQRALRTAIPHVALNWVLLIGLGFAWWHWWAGHWRILAVLTAVGFLYSVGRAARHLQGHRRALRSLARETAGPCGHERRLLDDPASVVTVRRWAGPSCPSTGFIRYSEGSPATRLATRWQAEKSVEKVINAPEGRDVVFDWDRKPGRVDFQLVSAHDVAARRKKRARWVHGTVAKLFPARRGLEDELDVALEWADADSTDIARMDVALGTYDVADRSFRERVEAVLDEQVKVVDHTWIYDWSTPGLLAATAVPNGSGEAARKNTARKVSNVVVGAVARALTARDSAGVVVDVAQWVPEDKKAANTPTRIVVTFGVVDFSAGEDQQRFEALVDQALENEWPDRVWIPEWSFGHDASVTLKAVPKTHKDALRKHELARLRGVTRTKFRVARGGTPVVVDVTRWQSGAGQERAEELTVEFGTYDVSDPDKRRAVETHFDAITDHDWSFAWDPQAGRLTMQAVPALPDFIAFPDPGTPEHERWHEEFRAGRIILGPAKGGQEAVIDLNKLPHTLIGGATGAGKSVALTLCLYGALTNHERINLVIIDPKVTDFTTYSAYPGVVMFGINQVSRMHEELAEIAAFVVRTMNARQELLQTYGARDLRELRRRCAAGLTAGLELHEIPVRLIVFFDEAKAAFQKVTDEIAREFQTSAKSNFEQLGLLARALEINLILAAQKPTAEDIGTSIRSMCGNRVALGFLGPIESKQVLDNNLATFLSGAPKGRGVMVDATGQEQVFQTLWMPDITSAHPDHPDRTVLGVTDRIHEVLEATGWTPVQSPYTAEIATKDGSLKSVTVSRTQWISPDAAVAVGP